MPLNNLQFGFMLIAMSLSTCADQSTVATVPADAPYSAMEQCNADALLDRSKQFLEAVNIGDRKILAQEFNLPENLFNYMNAQRPDGLNTSVIFGAETVQVTIIDGEYENGKLVIFSEAAVAPKLSEIDFLQSKKFESFVVCHFVCNADYKWRLSSNTCFEETGDPFHGDY